VEKGYLWGNMLKFYVLSLLRLALVYLSIQNNVEINALSREGVHLGDNCSIGEKTIIRVSGSLIEIGKGFWLGNYSTLGNDCFVGAAGGVKIGNYVAMGQNVRFHSENHEFSDPNRKIYEQGTNHKGITIGDDCWIGAGAVFLDGVSVGNGCVIGANTLVNRNIPVYAIAVGNPVRVIRKRK
jgi:acetyltransferase-like isoleucine patch superfamily enzyme